MKSYDHEFKIQAVALSESIGSTKLNIPHL